MIPLGTDHRRRRPTLVTYWLIGLNVGVFLVMAILERVDPGSHERMFSALQLAMGPRGGGEMMSALRASLGEDGAIPRFHVWSLITYQFVHGGIVHLLGNMLFLFVFGPGIEDRFRRIGFLAFYLLGGVFAGLAHLWLGGETVVVGGETVYFVAPVVGASGSIAAVTGAFIVLFPLVGVRVLWFFFLIGVFTVPAWWVILIGIVWDFVQSGNPGRIAHMAHIGGYVFGIGIAWSLLAGKVIPREPYDLFSMARQAKRRRAFREITSRSGSSPWSNDAGRVERRERGLRRRERDEDAGGAHRGPGARGEGPKPGVARTGERDDSAMRRRSEIAGDLSGGRLADAARKYEALLNDDPEAMLHREAQLDLGNALFAEGRHQAALVAYRLLVTRYPQGREADEVRLLMALINARYLNDPVEAKRLLGLISMENLDESHQRLMSTVQGELG
ncbi:MAG: rhomboid family intramembrane serine protease [Phycisphaerales bacterium]